VIGLDTNVLVRYLTQDDPAQARQANALVAEATHHSRRCFIGSVVLCELTWVLRESYDRTKADLVKTLDLILATKQFEIGDKDLVREALEAYRAGRADFADHLIGADHGHAGCTETVTFDRRLRGASRFRVLSAG
jgi:predicted nucleic-acid-binding protein